MRFGTVVLVSVISAMVTSVVASAVFWNLAEKGVIFQEKVPVPVLVGRSEAEARIALASAGLSLVVSGRELDRTMEPGKISSQIPAAGNPAPKNGVVQVVVSAERKQVKVPPLGGLSRAEALSVLLAAKLPVGRVIRQVSSTVPADHVISSLPEAGSVVAPEAKVALVVAQGGGDDDADEEEGAQAANSGRGEQRSAGRSSARSSGSGRVPHLVNKRIGYARTLLQRAGLSVGSISYGRDEDKMEGRVLSQSPSAGAMLPRGSAVHLTINRHDL